jgi:hypothetical protein
VTSSPLPLPWTGPRFSNRSSSRKRWQVRVVTWMQPGPGGDAMRLAVLMVSPHRLSVNRLRPITPATTGRLWMPTPGDTCFQVLPSLVRCG